MKWGILRPSELIIPLTLLAFIGPVITFLGGVLSTTTRWIFLLGLALYLLFVRHRDVAAISRHPLFWMVMVYAIWCLTTILWSEEPILSFVKSVGFVLLAVTMMVGGYSWVAHHERARTCDFLWLFAVFSLLASLFGQVEQNIDVGSVVYGGLTGNPNALGFLLAITSVWLIWQALLAYQTDRNGFRLFMGLLAVNTYYLFLSHSRASLLICAFIVLGLLLGLAQIRRWLPSLLVAVILAALVYNFSLSVQDVVNQYIYKSSLGYLESFEEGVEFGMWYSRAVIWEESYARAIHGGLIGVGYGVNAGEKFVGEIGASLSSGQYGREHGNAQMAILEQIGIVGFGIYLVLILGIFRYAIRGLRRSRINADRVAIGLMGGAIVGLLVQSMLEAWWVAPGSPESATFWMLLGALLAVTARARQPASLPSDQATALDTTAGDSAMVTTGARS